MPSQVLIRSHQSENEIIKAGVPHCCVLGSALFLVYVKYIALISNRAKMKFLAYATSYKYRKQNFPDYLQSLLPEKLVAMWPTSI